MGDNTTDLPPSTIKYEGIFDWHQLYTLIHTWLKARKFSYVEAKNAKKPGTYGYEFEYEAVGEREESGYVKFKIEIAIKSMHTEDVEVIVNGEKKQKNKTGFMSITMKPSVELDWKKDSQWQKTNFNKGVQKLMHRYVMKKDIDKSTDKLYYETYNLQTKIRQTLDLEHKYNAYGK